MALDARDATRCLGEGAMSVLNEWVATWRASLDCRGELTSDQLDELESHLRDGVERTRQLGLSDRDAFLLAAARVGTPDAIRAEYGKAHPENIWVTRTFWMVVGFLSFQAAGTLVGTLSQAAVAATARYFDWYYLLVISSLVSVAAWAAGLYYYDSRLGSLARPRSLSLAVVIAILVSIPLLSVLVDAGIAMWMVRNVDRYGAAMIAVRGQSLLLSVAVPIGLLLYSRSLRGKRTGKRSASRTPLG